MFSWMILPMSHVLKSVVQAVGLSKQKDFARLDLTRHGLQVEKAKVGPLGSPLFDSAVSISPGPE